MNTHINSLTLQFFRRGLGDFFIGCLFTTEFSTPFVSLGKILIQVTLTSAAFATFVFTFIVVNKYLEFAALKRLEYFNVLCLCCNVLCTEQIVVIFHFPSCVSPDNQLGLDDTRLHRINGIMVLLSFFTCRILIFPFMYWMYSRQFGIPLHRVAFHLPLQCNVGNLVILAPQIYWFILLLRKANRLYLRQRKVKGGGNKGSTD